MLQVVFLLIGLLSLFLLYYGTGKNKRLIFVFIGWQLLIGILAYNHFFIEKPTLFPLAILGTIPLTVWGLKIVDKKKINPKLLLGIHILRVPVELVLYQLYLQGKIPKLMTFAGWNFDIIIGLSAMLVLIYCILTKRRINQYFLKIWNSIGLVFLLVIVSFAILSSPLPIQQLAFDQPNIAVLEFPYCFLPTCVVPIVLTSHVLMLLKIERV